MIDQTKIERLLVNSLVDDRFSKDEKNALHTLLVSIQKQDELLAFARNKAFDLFREYYLKYPENFVYGTNWLERVIKTIDGIRCGWVSQPALSCFSPGKNCANQIISSIASARQTIDVCVFTISDDRISDALLQAYRAGVSVQIVSDNDKSNDLGSDIHYLAKQGMPVKLDRSSYHMHHKFALFDRHLDRRFLINGSFNWTRSASTSNEENITVLYERQLIESFSKAFDALWAECKTI